MKFYLSMYFHLSVYFTRIFWMEQNVLVQFGPIPEAGTCTLKPNSGYALTTAYNVTCSGFTAEGLPLKYSIYSHQEPDFTKGIL